MLRILTLAVLLGALAFIAPAAGAAPPDQRHSGHGGAWHGGHVGFRGPVVIVEPLPVLPPPLPVVAPYAVPVPVSVPVAVPVAAPVPVAVPAPAPTYLPAALPSYAPALPVGAPNCQVLYSGC